MLRHSDATYYARDLTSSILDFYTVHVEFDVLSLWHSVNLFLPLGVCVR